MSTPTKDEGAADGVKHPTWCVPSECLAGSLTTSQRHRSAPETMYLQDDAYSTMLVTRVIESVFQPGKMSLEVAVFTDDTDEPHEELTFSSEDLLLMARFFLRVVADAVIAEGTPMGYFFAKSA